jgi:hypothetical protein
LFVLSHKHIITYFNATALAISFVISVLFVVLLLRHIVLFRRFMSIDNISFIYISGSFPRTVQLNNSSAGGTFVDACGVVLYNRRNLLSSCCHGRFSMCAVFKALPRGCMNLSASALPCGHLGLENVAFIPRTSR